MDPAQLAADLGALLPEGAVSSGDSDRTLHSEDLSFHPPHLPAVVVFAAGTDEVSRVLRFAAERRVPVVPFGAGSSLEGHVIPVAGGISLDLSRLDEIVAIRPGELTATVGAGVTRLALERRLGEHGLFFPIDPGADASLGGMAATNAAGTMSVRYGKMRSQVLELEAVLPGGGVIRTGSRAAKTSAGYDTTGLLVGSEGTLAVITELTLRVQGIPEAQAVIRAALPDVAGACRASCAIVAAGIPALRLELLDEWEVEALNAYADTGLPPGALLFVELAGSSAEVEAEVEEVRAMLAEAGARSIEEERDPTRRARLWRARHDVFFAEKAMAPGKESLSTDVCVPLSELEGTLRGSRRALDRLGLTGGISAHAGDGNVHVGLLIDPGDRDEMARVAELTEELVDYALARGGTCSGEHGIGLGKIGALEREHGDQIELMRSIKAAFDPHGVMNPGKVLREERGDAGGIEVGAIEVRSPYSGELIEALPPVGGGEIEEAIDRAAAALTVELPVHRRVAILEGVATRVEAARDEFAELLALEAGKPLRDGREEADRAALTARLAAAEASRLDGELIPLAGTGQGSGRLAFTRRVPLGVVGAITPFNFPLNLVMHKVAPALAAGCPVVLKPAEKTPLCAKRLAAIFHAAGLPRDRLRLLIGDPVQIGDALCRDPRVRLISFTGSARVGALLQDGAPRKRVALELGNATPVIVTAGVDVERVAAKLVRGAFRVAGQACISVQRVYAERAIGDSLVRAVAERAERLRCGDPLDPEVEVGPVISAEARDRVLEIVAEARRCGAIQLTGGHLHGNLIAPVVLAGADAGSRVESEEVFGPVVSINTVGSLDEAIERANATEYGLQAAIFTNRLDLALAATSRLEFAGVLVNESPSYRADAMPYGGTKASGNTREGPSRAVREMTEEKLFVMNLESVAAGSD